jgi:hypothetical protein
MSWVSGYHNYRGRTPKWKPVLAVFLVLVILASISVMLLQKYVVYDEAGMHKIVLPWEEGGAEEMGPEDFELTIQTADGDAERDIRVIRGYILPLHPDPEMWSLAARQAKEVLGEDCNTVVMTLKDHEGNIYFDSAAALPDTVQFEEDVTNPPLDAAASGLIWEHSIARISCFHDPKAANRETETMGLMNTGGFLFYDGNNSQWLDPAKEGARKYLCEISREAAEMGFKEILLTDVSYPTEGKLDKIAYGEKDPAENLVEFLREMKQTLAPYGAVLSVELSEQVILDSGESLGGQELASIAAQVDRIYAKTEPERVNPLAAAVNAAGEAVFVPELVGYSEKVTGSYVMDLWID